MRCAGRAFVVGGLVLVGVLLPATAAGAATRVVDDDKVQCPTAPFSTIQDGVDAAAAGDTVLVCNGVYREAVSIAGPAKNGVQLVANATHFATIMLPDDTIGPMVQIFGSQNVQVRRFRIDGDNINGGVPHAAVAIENGTGATISDNLITQDDADGGGFFVGVRSFGSSRLRITGNRIEGYETGGVGIDDGLQHIVSNNTITANPTLFDEETAQVGVGFGGQVEATSNRISGNRSNRPDERGTGIRDVSSFFGITGNRISGNWVTDNDVGLDLSSTGALVSANAVLRNGEQGILLGAESASNKLERNDARGNGGLDCEDRTAGSEPTKRGFPNYTTRNSWVNNKGHDASPAPICTPTGAAGQPVG